MNVVYLKKRGEEKDKDGKSTNKRTVKKKKAKIIEKVRQTKEKRGNKEVS